MPPVDFKLYMVGDRHQTAGRPLTDVVRAAAEAGVPALQFREKDLSLRGQFELAREIHAITRHYGMKFLINDRIDLCLALDADGVHLPSNGFPAGAARRLLGPKKWIGMSCHSEKEVKQAETLGANFAVLGPVFDTPSKRPYGPPLSLSGFRKIKSTTRLPLFAIGGIDIHKIPAVFSAGANGVAMISAITKAGDVRNASRCILKEIVRTTHPAR
ncbi:MAG: thiamine phosphate synthase [Nitrospiria bacterium]